MVVIDGMQMGGYGYRGHGIAIQSEEHILWANSVETDEIGSIHFKTCSGYASWVIAPGL